MSRFFKANGLHRRIEGWPLVFTILTTLAILVGTVVEFAPIFLIGSATAPIATLTPYSPLESVGRDIYVAEGCNNCHSQMVRPFQDEALRYGPASTAGEGSYDSPHLWGSKRTGPDLARLGGKYPDLWHVRHMDNPRSTSPNSIMPRYAHLLVNRLDLASLPAHLRGQRRIGIPYTEDQIANAAALAQAQADSIAANVVTQGGPERLETKQIVALVAYLQRLGIDRARLDETTPDDRAEPSLEAHEVKEIYETILPPSERPATTGPEDR